MTELDYLNHKIQDIKDNIEQLNKDLNSLEKLRRNIIEQNCTHDFKSTGYCKQETFLSFVLNEVICTKCGKKDWTGS